MPPVEEARDVFRGLGYTVSGSGTELTAERKWRTVRVTAMTAEEAIECRRPFTDGGADTAAPGDDLRCFVTWHEYTGELRSRLEGRTTPFEWAVVGVDDAGDYEVRARSA
jgi:hypothetical protein